METLCAQSASIVRLCIPSSRTDIDLGLDQDSGLAKQTHDATIASTALPLEAPSYANMISRVCFGDRSREGKKIYGRKPLKVRGPSVGVHVLETCDDYSIIHPILRS